MYNWIKGGVAILTAKMEDGQLIVLTPEFKRDQLRKWQRSIVFFCPQCSLPVQLKVGDIMIPHFAHQKGDACTSTFSEGESKAHLQGKQQLYLFLKKQIKEVTLEPFLNRLSQRPDLLAITPFGTIPIEFQCSTSVKTRLSLASPYRVR